MVGALIGTLIAGLIIGVLGRLILPGEQDIGWPQTVGLGVVASLIVGLIMGSWAPLILVWIVAAIVAAVLLSFALKKGWLNAK